MQVSCVQDRAKVLYFPLTPASTITSSRQGGKVDHLILQPNYFICCFRLHVIESRAGQMVHCYSPLRRRDLQCTEPSLFDLHGYASLSQGLQSFLSLSDRLLRMSLR